MTLSRRHFSALVLGLPLVGLSALPARAATAQVSIKGMKFNPNTIEIAAGDSVTFVNEDGAPHTATANDGSFDTGKLAKGQSATLTFASPGSYDFFCAVHPMMKGKVVVS